MSTIAAEASKVVATVGDQVGEVVFPVGNGAHFGDFHRFADEAVQGLASGVFDDQHRPPGVA